MFLNLDGNGALYRQLYRALRAEILGGSLAPGARLPSTRSIAAELGISRNVAILAYERLLDEGYVEARRGSGTVVARGLRAQAATLHTLRASPPAGGRSADASDCRRRERAAGSHRRAESSGAPRPERAAGSPLGFESQPRGRRASGARRGREPRSTRTATGSAERPVTVAGASASERLAAAGARALDIAQTMPLSWELPGEPLPYDFRFGRPAFSDFPHASWSRVLGRRARKPSRADLDYGSPQGRLELREALAERLRRFRGIETGPERIVIVNGSQQALDLVARVLIDSGDRVLIEEPHYLGARWVFAAAGAELLPATVDEQGMRVPDPSPLPATPKLAYVTPSHQFPTGAVLPLARRLQLLEWALAVRAFVVEDDYDSDYRYSGRPLPALAGLDEGRRVIYVGTFSKQMFPALRLGYLVLPAVLVAPVVAAKALADTGSSALEQLALADFIADGHFERHLNRSRLRNAARREALLVAIAEHFGERAEVCGDSAGLHLLLWLRNRRGGAIGSVARKAAAAGVALYSVSPYYLSPPQRSGVLLGYGTMEPPVIREGIARLAAALG